MSAKDRPHSKHCTDAYRNNHALIWGKKADDSASRSTAELGAALKGTGFVVCEFGPDDDICECCHKDQVQLYWRSSDPFSQDGGYYCAKCVTAEHMENETCGIAK